MYGVYATICPCMQANDCKIWEAENRISDDLGCCESKLSLQGVSRGLFVFLVAYIYGGIMNFFSF